jgi:hypothetical protein
LFAQKKHDAGKSEALRALDLFKKSGSTQSVKFCEELLNRMKSAMENQTTISKVSFLGTSPHPSSANVNFLAGSTPAMKILPMGLARRSQSPMRILFTLFFLKNIFSIDE